jgi:hypothetical protein
VQALGLRPVARDIVKILGIGADLLEQRPLRLDVREVLLALIFLLAFFQQPMFPPDAFQYAMRDGQVELANEPPRAEGVQRFAKFDELRLGRGRCFLCLVVTSARKRDQPGRAALLKAAQPLADRGHGGSEKPRSWFNPALLGAFHEPQTMVVGVFHLTHQIEITNGGSHNATILSAARWPALPPAGQLTPIAASHSNTSTSLGGYDVSRLSHSSIKFDKSNRVGVFQELLRFLGGNPGFASSDVPLGYLLPQILPGHRLWCYATGRVERFFTVQRFDVLHASSTKGVWINIYLDRSDLERVGISESKALADCGFAGEFEIATGIAPKGWTCFQQRTPTPYMSDPAEALAQIMAKMRTKIWETVKIDSPYRKPYVYCCPVGERGARVPQLLSIYLLMFFLGYVTRYTPGYFEDLLDSKFGPLFETFVSESPMQFLYLMASEILGREVSKPAII